MEHDKCPLGEGADCEMCRLKCQLPLIAAENNYRELREVAMEAQKLLDGGGTARPKYTQKLSTALKNVGLKG